MVEAISLAIDLAVDRRALLSERGTLSYRPNVFLITDGHPTDPGKPARRLAPPDSEFRRWPRSATGCCSSPWASRRLTRPYFAYWPQRPTTRPRPSSASCCGSLHLERLGAARRRRAHHLHPRPEDVPPGRAVDRPGRAVDRPGRGGRGRHEPSGLPSAWRGPALRTALRRVFGASVSGAGHLRGDCRARMPTAATTTSPRVPSSSRSPTVPGAGERSAGAALAVGVAVDVLRETLPAAGHPDDGRPGSEFSARPPS